MSIRRSKPPRTCSSKHGYLALLSRYPLIAEGLWKNAPFYQDMKNDHMGKSLLYMAVLRLWSQKPEFLKYM